MTFQEEWSPWLLAPFSQTTNRRLADWTIALVMWLEKLLQYTAVVVFLCISCFWPHPPANSRHTWSQSVWWPWLWKLGNYRLQRRQKKMLTDATKVRLHIIRVNFNFPFKSWPKVDLHIIHECILHSRPYCILLKSNCLHSGHTHRNNRLTTFPRSLKWSLMTIHSWFGC